MDVYRLFVAIVDLHELALSRPGCFEGLLGRKCALEGCGKGVALEEGEGLDERFAGFCSLLPQHATERMKVSEDSIAQLRSTRTSLRRRLRQVNLQAHIVLWLGLRDQQASILPLQHVQRAELRELVPAPDVHRQHDRRLHVRRGHVKTHAIKVNELDVEA